MNLKDEYSEDEFAELITDETDRIELKTGLGSKPLQEGMVALSNADGGVILSGVKPDGEVMGRKLDQGAEDRVHEAAMAARDLGRYHVREIVVGPRTVIGIQVEKRVEGFAQTSDGRVLLRRGAHNVALFGPDLVRFGNERSLRRFELTDTGVSLADVTEDALRDVAMAFAVDPAAADLSQHLHQRGLLTPAGTLTVAGALFLTDPAESLAQNKAMIEVRRYPQEGGEYDRRNEFRGPLQQQVAVAAQFLTAEIGSDLVVTGVYRRDLPRLPDVVIREAIANAVAHRSYEAQGTAVIVELRPDRVVITSPGRFPEPVTLENLRQAQAARNQHVLDALRRFNLAEDAGRGVDVMQDSMQEALLDPPEFEEPPHAVRVTLPLRGPITGRERAWVSELERRGDLKPGDRLLLVHAARGKELTNARAREILHLGHIEARAALQRLRDAELLEQHGMRGGATYTLVEEVAPPAAFRMTPAQIDALIVDEAARRPLTNEIVREMTGLSRDAVLTVLSRLVKQGRLVRTGQRRGTRYTNPDPAQPELPE